MAPRRDPCVALLSIDPVWEDPSGDFVPFTYGVRKLEASLRTAEDLAHVDTHVIDLRSRAPQAFFEAVTAVRPTLVCASLYLWSIGPFMALAEQLKAWDPSIQIVVGGPQARTSVFALGAYAPMARCVDAAVTDDGEAIIRDIVRRHQEDGWTRMPGLLVPSALGWRSTGTVDRVDINAFASPYHIDSAPAQRTGYLETFRGCPIHCSFCQWGEQSATRVHSVEYLASHLEGLRRARVPNVFCVDAAFNLSPRAFRNLAAAEQQTGVLAETTVHGHLYPTFLRDEHLELLTSFGRCQVAIGVQSFDPEVLHRLGRPFDLDRFARVCDVVRAHWPIELELMLGLPGDTPASFRKTFERAIEIADTVRVFWTLVLPDALLDRAPGFDIDFDPHTWLIRSCKGWSPESIRRELDHVKRVALAHENAVVADHWAGFRVRRSDKQQPGPRLTIDEAGDREVATAEPAVVEAARLRVAQIAGWNLRTIRHRRTGVYFDLDGPATAVVLEAVRATPERASFVERDGIAYSHLGDMPRDHAEPLREVIAMVHADARRLLSEPVAD